MKFEKDKPHPSHSLSPNRARFRKIGGRSQDAAGGAAISTDYDPATWRALAGALWMRWASESDDDRIGNVPGYWVDRIGFRLARATEASAIVTKEGITPLEWSRRDYPTMLSRWAKVTPGVAGFPPSSWDEPMGVLPLAERMLRAFREILPRFGLSDFRGKFRLDPSQSWQHFYADSVFYPGPPAFNGGSFIHRFTPDHASRLLAEEGPRGPLEFSVALTAVHEGLHTLQTGDSLLCEFVVSLMWGALLTETQMWHWQLDPTTLRTANREVSHLRGVEVDEPAIGNCVRDAAMGIPALFGDPRWYGTLCAAGWLFDTRRCRYDDYLAFVASALRNRSTSAPSILDAAMMSRMSPDTSRWRRTKRNISVIRHL